MSPKPNIVVLTETYLPCGIHDSELGLIGYNIFRIDRYNYQDSPYGGGVLIAIEDCYESNLITLQLENSSKCEQLFMKLKFNEVNYVLEAVYVPNKNMNECYKFHKKSIKQLKNKYLSSEFIILSDFNLPKTSWINTDSAQANFSLEELNVAENVFTIQNCYSNIQHYPVHQGRTYTLDLCFSSLSSGQFKVIESLDSLVNIETRNHWSVFFELCHIETKNLKQRPYVLNFANAV